MKSQERQTGVVRTVHHQLLVGNLHVGNIRIASGTNLSNGRHLAGCVFLQPMRTFGSRRVGSSPRRSSGLVSRSAARGISCGVLLLLGSILVHIVANLDAIAGVRRPSTCAPHRSGRVLDGKLPLLRRSLGVVILAPLLVRSSRLLVGLAATMGIDTRCARGRRRVARTRQASGAASGCTRRGRPRHLLPLQHNPALGLLRKVGQTARAHARAQGACSR